MTSWGMAPFLRVTLIVFLTTTYISLPTPALAQDGKTACVISTVEPMEKAFLKCLFPEDVSRTRKDFTVNLYHSAGNPDPVLDCWWLRGNLHCLIQPQYSYNKTISNVLVLEIPRVSAQLLGTYACQFANMAPETITTCDLNFHLEGRTVCEIPSVKEQAETSLTCYFPEDLSKTRADFAVDHYSSSGATDQVLHCRWNEASLECNTVRGYKLDNRFTNHLTLKIPSASAGHEGSYSCHIKDATSVRFENCYFRLEREGRTVCEIPSVKEQTETSLTCYFPEDLSKTRAGFSVYHHSSAGVTDQVLHCRWNEASLECNTVRGYKFDNRVTNHLTLKIPSASAGHEGSYSCHIKDATSVRFENCSFRLERDKTSSCNMPSVREMEPTALTCVFGVDLNETRKDFKVVHLSGQGKEAAEILNCTWADNQLLCTTAPGYEFNNSVTNRLVVSVPRATPQHNGTYTCHLQSSEFENAQSCEFYLQTSTSPPAVSVPVIAAASVIVICIPLTLIIVFFVCRHRASTPPKTDEEQPMMLKSLELAQRDKITEDLLIFLRNEFSKMYPDCNTKSYFVPSLYLNIKMYRTVNVGGEQVYITQPLQGKIVKYHMAMYRVLTSLHLVAKHVKGMFVISQFSYDNYLAAVKEKFPGHTLPLPAALREQDGWYGNFDVLIVHRQLGVLVGAVKACGNDPTPGASETDDVTLVEELQKACRQLDSAERMLKHLMSDLKTIIPVHKMLFLPNLSQGHLRIILDQHKDLAETLSTCLGISETSDLHKECLCAEALEEASGSDELKDWLYRRFSPSNGEESVKDDQTVAVLSRFCGPATRWSFNIPGGLKTLVPSTTLSDSVNLTGDLFNSPVLHQEQLDVLNADEPLVFLTGPPASGKTRTLVLAGRRWLAEGHDVLVVSTWEGSQAASAMMYTELSRDSRETAPSNASGCVILRDIDLEQKGMENNIKAMSKMAEGGSLYIIADEAGPYIRTEKPPFKVFVDELQKQVPELHLWAASCFYHIAPECCDVRVFTETFTCPPTILLNPELVQIASECDVITHNPDSRTSAPTEGPPVKFVQHGDRGHSKGQPHECKKCAQEVAAFLRTLRICNKGECPMMKTSGSEHLHYNDVMLILETDFDGTTGFCKELQKQGSLKMNVLKKTVKTMQSSLTFQYNEVLVAKGKHALGVKRKIIIYVEGNPEKSKEMSASLKRIRGLTSSTSQLIWVKGLR